MFYFTLPFFLLQKLAEVQRTIDPGFIGQQQSEKERERNRKREIVVAAVAESAALLPSRRHPCLSVPSPLLVDAVSATVRHRCCFPRSSKPLLLLVDAVAVTRRHRLQLPVS
ncbi:hypothetical protein LWI29_009796 [Acer saccharum]|uniref:Uncharacterized protein n=1 Tax=Acer saccharum TaxID=4024 RepID=A0AA39VYW5_ACESA|nr:hypothetical protein LWI29_009796 [Acer saccharum]